MATSTVYTVELPERDDGVYVFASEADAERFVDAVLQASGVAHDDLFWPCIQREQTVCDTAMTDALIASELDD